jgi:protein-S-isoprenylcysteine O-methyltransferase Ste14
MSRFTTAIVPLIMPVAVGAIIFGAAGRWDLPFVWAVVGVMTVFYLALAALADPDMMRERMRPGPGSRDRLTRFLGGGMLLGHWMLVGLDVGRWQWSLIHWQVQVAGFVGYVVAMSALLWVVCTNPFYSSVVRLQTDRGHHVITNGPYRFVRHPGYAASLLAMLGGGLALGSWLAMLPILVFFGLFIRRTLLEDRMLQQELAGYAEYAQQVRYRLIVGVF